MGRHQPLRVWIGCLYLMGLNLSHQQIAQELDLHKDDVHAMTPQLRCSLLCLWLRPHRGISQENLPLYLGFFKLVHNARRSGKALLGNLLETVLA